VSRQPVVLISTGVKAETNAETGLETYWSLAEMKREREREK